MQSTVRTAFAQNGYRTILVDADLRRPQLHLELLTTSLITLASATILANLASLEQTISPTETENLDLIPAGRHCPKPTLVLAGAAFSALIERLLGDL